MSAIITIYDYSCILMFARERLRSTGTGFSHSSLTCTCSGLLLAAGSKTFTSSPLSLINHHTCASCTWSGLPCSQNFPSHNRWIGEMVESRPCSRPELDWFYLMAYCKCTLHIALSTPHCLLRARCRDLSLSAFFTTHIIFMHDRILVSFPLSLHALQCRHFTCCVGSVLQEPEVPCSPVWPYELSLSQSW